MSDLSRAQHPSLDKEAWPRPQANAAKPPLMERTAWFVQPPRQRLRRGRPALRRRGLTCLLQPGDLSQ
jgi:hypothetical protein